MSALMTVPNLWAVATSSAPGPAPAPEPAPVDKREELPKPVIPVEFYRKHTEALLRRYMHLSMEMGRTPSALGNTVFRGRVSTYKVRSFEDAIIFVFDIEKCMKRLDPFSQVLLARIALQEYTQGEAAELVGQSLRSIVRKYAEALDCLTVIFLELDLLSVEPPRSCQERG